MKIPPTRSACFRAGCRNLFWYLACVSTLTFGSGRASAAEPHIYPLPSCKSFSKAAAKISGRLGLYYWPDSLSLPGGKLPTWVSVEAGSYLPSIQRLYSNDNPILLSDPFLKSLVSSRPDVELSVLKQNIARGWLKASVATFTLDGPGTSATLLRVENLQENVGTLRATGSRSKASQYQSRYILLRSESDPEYDGHVIDPSGAGDNTSLSIIRFGDRAAWIDAEGGDIFYVSGTKPLVAVHFCNHTNPRSNHD